MTATLLVHDRPASVTPPAMSTMEWRRVCPDLEEPLARFFSTISETDSRFFRPHPFDAGRAKAIAHYQGRDIYGVLIEDRTVLCYGMLRGWDEGFAIPSLGIIVANEVRGKGISRLVMQILHAAARRRGAEKIRLKVYDDNLRAIALYTSLGYRFTDREGAQMVGFLDL